MEKPVIFFSHSSKDKDALGRLKARFVELTGGTIDVFLSSDGQSIRFGQNWVSKVEQALDRAKLMFVFLTPNSLESSWIYFECGHAYAKGIDVGPVGLFGVDIGRVGPPLSLLQGFNVTGHDALNNIIAKVNETFNFSCKLGFEKADYEALMSAGPVEATRFWGQHVAAIKDVTMRARQIPSKEVLDTVVTALEALDAPVIRSGNTFEIEGASITVETGSHPSLHAEIDPMLASVALPRVEAIFAHVPTTTGFTHPLSLVFSPSVRCQWRNYQTMARLAGSEAKVGGGAPEGPWYRFGDLCFEVGHTSRPTQAALSLQRMDGRVSAGRVADLIDLLFDRNVLWYHDPYDPGLLE